MSDSYQPNGETRSRSAWRRVIQDWAESGKSQRHYCEDAGLSYHQFLRWRRCLEAETDTVSLATFTPVQEPASSTSAESSSLELEVANKFRLKVTDATSAQLLRMTLNCLEGLC